VTVADQAGFDPGEDEVQRVCGPASDDNLIGGEGGGQRFQNPVRIKGFAREEIEIDGSAMSDLDRKGGASDEKEAVACKNPSKASQESAGSGLKDGVFE